MTTGFKTPEEVIAGFGTSLAETRKMIPELTAAVKRKQQYPFLPAPIYLSQAELAEYGIELTEPMPEGWLFKITPGKDGGELTTSFITPDRWQIIGEDEYISPEGKTYTRTELDALMAPEVAPVYAPEAPRLDIAGMPREELAELYGEQELERWTWATQYELREALEYAEQDPEGFLAELLEVGRNEDTERLLKQMFGATDAQIGEIFGEAPTEMPEIPAEGLEFELASPVYAEEAPQPSVIATIKPDYSVWVEGKKEGSYDPETGQFEPPEPPLWLKILGYINYPFKQFGAFVSAPWMFTDEEKARFVELGIENEPYPVKLIEKWRMRGELDESEPIKEYQAKAVEEYEKLSWWQQMLWELPLWMVVAHGIGKIPIKGVPISTWEARAFRGILHRAGLTKLPPTQRSMDAQWATVRRAAKAIDRAPSQPARLAALKNYIRQENILYDIMWRAHLAGTINERVIWNQSAQAARLGAQATRLEPILYFKQPGLITMINQAAKETGVSQPLAEAVSKCYTRMVLEWSTHKPTFAVEALRSAGYGQNLINKMSVEAAFIHLTHALGAEGIVTLLLKGYAQTVLKIPVDLMPPASVEIGELPIEPPATYEPPTTAPIMPTEMTIPPTEDIIKASIEPNLARTLLRGASNLPGGKGIVGAIDPRALVPHTPETIADAINKNAIVWREINKIGQGVKAVKLGSLAGITTNAAKMFGFNTNALSTKMINRLLPQYKGTVEAGTLEHVFTHPEMYNWTGFRKGFEYVTKTHKIYTEGLNLLRAEGVAPENVTEDWWIHRVVEGKYDANGELIAIRGRPGMRRRFAAKRSFDMHRKAPTMYEGMSWKIKYSEKPELSVSTYIEEAYRKIANARFYGAVDKDLEAIGMAGKLPTELLKERFPEIFERAETTAERAKDLGNFHKVVSRAVRGEIPTTQTLNAIAKRFPELGRRFRELVQEPATEIKQLRELLNESQKAISQLESQLKAKEIKPDTITPQAIPDELKLAEAFGVMSYEDRLAFRSTMDDQLEELARTIYEHEAELAVSKEWLTTEPARRLLGLVKKTGWYKGEVSNLTIKQYRDITGKEVRPTILTADKKHVRWEYSLDDVATEMGYKSGDELKEAIEATAEANIKIKDLTQLIALVDGRLTDIKRMLAILNSVDVKPEFIPQAIVPEVVTPVAPEVTKGKYFTLKKAQDEVRIIPKNLTDEQLQEHIVKLRDYKGYIDRSDMERLVEGGYYERVIDPSAAGLTPKDPWLQTNLGQALDEATKEKLSRPSMAAIPKAEIGMPEAGLQVDMFGYQIPVFPAGKGVVTQISMDEYNRLIELRKAAGLEGPPPNVAIKPAIEGISEKPEFAKVTYEIPKIKTVNERKAGLEALRKQVKLLTQELKPEYWRARFERATKMEAIREAPGIGKGYIMHPHFGGKIYDQEFIDAVNKFMGHDAGYKVLKFTSNMAGILRVTKAAMDFSFMAIQGLPAIGLAFSTMATNPIKGAKMMTECMKATLYPVRAVFDPEWMYRYLGKMEAEATQRNSFGGSSVAVDFFEKAKALGFIPGKPYERFELAFFGAGELIRNPFWEAMKEEAIRTGNEFQLARFLDRMTGIISTEAMGVPTTVRQLESSFVWFAPRYTRACLTMLANCFRGGYTGAKARRSLGGMIAAGILMYSVTQYGISKLQGRSNEEAWEDILGGFGVVRDPITGEWDWKPSARMMSFKIGNYNIGIGGFWYGLVRLAGNIMATVNEVGDRERIDLVRIMKNGSFNKRDNPFIYWWFSRSSPLNSFMFEAGWPLLKSAFSGELQAGADFFGYPIETWQEYVAYMITRFEPIWMEQGLNPWIPYAARDYEIPEDEARIVVPIVELFGMRSFPEGGWTIFYDRVNELLTHLPEDVLREYFTEDELAKILEAQEGGKLNWSHLPKPLQQQLLKMYPELKELYDKALSDSGLRGSNVWKQWEGQVEAEKTKYYDYGNNLVDRLMAGGIDTRELRELWSDAGSTYGSGLETIEATPFYKLIYDYFEQRQAEGVKYDWKLSLALQEYTSIMFADYLDANGDMDWDARDRAVDAYIEEWGEETYDIIRQMYADKKLMEGLSPVLARMADDKDKLGREYWRLPWKPIIEMDEADVPAEFHALWKQYQDLKTDAEREAFLEAHPDLGKDWRAEYRLAHPEADAMLALWGYGGKLQTKEAYDLVTKWGQELGIPLAQMGLGLPPRNLVDYYFELNKIVAETSGNSAEARLYKLQHPEYLTWGLEQGIWKDDLSDEHIEALRLQVNFKKEFADYDAIKFADATQQREARDKYLEGHPEFADARRRVDAYSLDLPDEMIGQYSEYYSLPEKGDWRARYRLEHPDFDKAMIDKVDWMPLEPEKVKPVQYDQIYLDFQNLFDAYDNVQGTATERDKAREEILKNNLAFAKARLRRNAYGLFVPENLVDKYVQYYSLPTKGYDQERFLKENQDYYEKVWLGILENKPIEFDKVPSEKLEILLDKYFYLPSGQPRLDLRCKSKELDDWFVSVHGYTPCYGTYRCGIGEKPEAEEEPTPWEAAAEAQAIKDWIERQRPGG